jgi:predicted AlkP superfamily phosphohydrolase/phosphomutase
MARPADSRRAAALLAALTCLLALTGFGAETEPVDERVVVLGFDGMDPVLARRWMEAGKLPNFSRLAEQGHFQELATSNPPQSPVAWSSFATGKGPGQHGIFDFLRRNPETYAPDFSISEDVPPEHVIKLFGLKVPLGSGEVINRRQGEPFWVRAEGQGARASVLRIPVTYPPDDVHRMLSGMGVPDLLGTQGTYTYYTTTRLADSGSSTRTVRVRPDREGRIEATFEGPPDPLLQSTEPMAVPLVMTPAEPGVQVRLGASELTLQAGEWSDWVRVRFDVTGPVGVSGLVRLLLVQGYPQPRLYVSPIQIDPENPAVPIASPSGYAAELVERIGLFHTIGMPEETWSLNEEHISDAAWLEMEKTILAEREAMWYDTLERNDSELVVGAFVQTDRVTHMFYRGLDEQHPRHADTAPEHRDAVEWIYREADRILGQTLDRLGPDDRLIVISDHGFAPFRTAVHLNRWLVDNGYLVLADGASESDVLFSSVDWSRSRAYALGLNGVFVNLAGREGQGIVAADEVEALKAEIAAGLTEWVDPDTGEPVVRRVFDGEEAYRGPEREDAPDLVVGYHRGYRASWQTTLGAVPAASMEPNRQKWSGDHCIDPALVPGVLFANFEPEVEVGSIRDVWRLTRRQIDTGGGQ